MGQEERLALRKRPKVEDIFIGAFVLFAFIYPFIIMSFIQVEDKKLKKVGWKDRLIITSLFISGVEECTIDRAAYVASFFEKKVLHELGGIDGLTRMCIENKDISEAEFSLQERIKKLGSVYVMELTVFGAGKNLKLKVYGRIYGEELKITGVESRVEGS